MTTLGDIIFALVWFGALIFGIRLMSNGWSLMTKREWKESHEKLPDDMSKEIEGSTHPEMQDIKPGEELIVVRFNKPEVDKDKFKLDSPALHGEDPLYKSLQERIDALREENNKDEEDDEDDGGDLVSAGR